MHDEAVALEKSVKEDTDARAKVTHLFRNALSRDPKPAEIDLALSYLEKGTLVEFAQVLLATNEEIFWP
jgi:hypothetical protein